jgi:hypothetical protein
VAYPVTLSELLEDKFRGDIRFRGDAYLKTERVSVTRVTADHIFAVVRDGVDYQTQLTRDDGLLKMYCNCASGGQTEAACKHLWATILAVDDGGYLCGSLKLNQMPPFIMEPSSFSLDDDDWEADSGDFLRTSRSSRLNSDAVNLKSQLRPWEVPLHDLRQAMNRGESASSTAEREIYYEIDIEQSREVGRLVVQTSQRQRRANGQWGKLKPLRLRPGDLDDIEREEDCRILAYLSGGTPERSNWYAQQTETQSTAYRYHVPFALSELLLPLMCATGRVRFQERGEKSKTVLEWDDAPPWDLTLRVVSDTNFDEPGWRLEGILTRDDAVMSMETARLLLPGGLVLTETTISRLRDFGAFEWVSLLRQNETVRIPSEEESELVEYLLDMPALPRLELPEELRLEEIQCEPTPHLVIASPSGTRWRLERLQGEVQFDYLGTLVSGSSSQWAIVQREQSRCIVRNREYESQAWSMLLEQGFRRLIDHRRSGHDVEISARELGPAVRLLMKQGWLIRADGKQVRQPGEMQFRVRSGIDWFELHADVDFEGQTASFPELLSALARGDSTIRLDDGSLGILPEDWAKQYGLLAGLGISEDDHLRFQNHQAGLLDALLAAQPCVDYDTQFRELSEKFRSFSGIETVKEPSGFQGELREYQREGLGWFEFLQEYQFGGCLADDMGLGKTVQMLALFLERLGSKKNKNPSLVVVPKSLMFNWRQECERFTPQVTVLEYAGTDRVGLLDEFQNYDLILTTYGTLRRDIVSLKEIPFDYVVLDEAQTIKNAGSQVAKASRLLQAKHRIALSGTPIENHLGDLWSIFEFLNPGMLGRSAIFKTFAENSEDHAMRTVLAQGLHPFILRRTKAEVASELPEKLEQTIYCDMEEKQRQQYDELREHYRNSLLGLIETQGLAKSKMHVLEALLRLRQACCHPGLLNPSAKEDPSAKLDVLCPYIEELLDKGHKVLVFSQFTSMLAIVKTHLDKRNIVYENLDGQTRNRQEHVERFQTDPDCGVFLISLKAGGLGLNLTAADYVFILDPWWNPAVEAQAIDRAHRVGQTKQVFAYRLICRNTVEEKIAELQTKKQSLADAILLADKSLIKDLTPEDLQMLLS